jgi:hypothetical protein
VHVLAFVLLALACSSSAAAAPRAACPGGSGTIRFLRGTTAHALSWSPDGSTLAFVRERRGYGRLMLMRRDKVLGSFAQLGYRLGCYGHHDWGLTWVE